MRVTTTNRDRDGAASAAAHAPGAGRSGNRSRNRTWIGIAAIVVSLGFVGAVLAAGSTARGTAEESRSAFEQESGEIASTLQLAIQRDQALMESAAAYITVNPDASNAEFARWAGALRWRSRYPEVLAFAFAVEVPAAELGAFSRVIEADPIDPSAKGEPFAVVPPGDRSSYCLPRLGQWRAGFGNDVPLGLDYCAGLSGGPLRAIRDSGQALYYPLDVGDETTVAITIPAYADGRPAATVKQRRDGFLGWLGITVAQEQILERTLQAHPGVAATLRYPQGDSEVTFSGGETPEDGETVTNDLENGWTLETVGSVASGSLWANAGALAWLAAGGTLSLVLGALVLVLGTGRSRARDLVAEKTGALRHQALHDALTGLPNRTLIADRTEQLLARNRRAGTECAALFMDLDDFKNVNDTLGHEAGDRLLVAVAARLRTALRDVDTIGRLGGDEFIVLIDGGELKAGPQLVAERLLDVLRQPFEIAGTSTGLAVSASVGIAIGDRANAGGLLRDADVALYEAKAAGRNRYAIYDRAMRSEVTHRIELEFDLRSALEKDQFRLVYQPIYDLDDLAIVGVEALLRWEHPTEGTIPPDDFIPILERSGQIRDVGRWVLDRACAQMASWHDRGHRLDLSVNLSARQLDYDRAVDDIRGALETTGLDPGSLIVEVTETALMESVEATTRRLGAIKQLGVRIAIDDFGTGYSSLAHLKQFPVDCLKIDRAFTSAIATSPESDALIGTLVQLGRDLGLSTLAEGIERPGQIDHLRGEHVSEGQGFLLSRPLDAEDLEAQVLDPLRSPSPADEASYS